VRLQANQRLLQRLVLGLAMVVLLSARVSHVGDTSESSQTLVAQHRAAKLAITASAHRPGSAPNFGDTSEGSKTLQGQADDLNAASFSPDGAASGRRIPNFSGRMPFSQERVFEDNIRSHFGSSSCNFQLEV
jgi:hypothetical protein